MARKCSSMFDEAMDPHQNMHRRVPTILAYYAGSRVTRFQYYARRPIRKLDVETAEGALRVMLWQMRAAEARPPKAVILQKRLEVGLRACSARSAGLAHSVKINHLICITSTSNRGKKTQFLEKAEKSALWRRRKIRTSTEILAYLFMGWITKQSQFSPDFKERAE